jgi:uncharacterized membrane protein
VKALMSGKAWLLLLISAVTAASVASGVVLAAAAKADFSLSATPSSQSVQQGQTTTFTVNESVSNGFASGVQLSVSGLPSGATGVFSPTQLTKGTTTATLSVSTSTTTPTGTTNGIVITGKSDALVHTASISLSVTPKATPSFTISASPSANTILPANTATYQVSVIGGGGFSGSVTLSVLGTLPGGMSASFSPASVTPGHTSTFTVTTKKNVATGSYTLTIAANASGQPQQTASVALNVSPTGKDFTITGSNFSGIAPGTTIPLDLSITNPNNLAISVSNVTVSVQSVSKAAGVPSSLPCSTGDYVVTQFATYPFTVAAGQTVKLSTIVGAGHPELLPSIGMPNSNTINQDGCRGATVTLAYTGAGQGA